jgi:alkaline phosphatase
MKKTITSLSLLLLLAFNGYSQNEDLQKSKRPKNVILMIGDGMSAVQIYAGLTANKTPFNLEEFKFIGFSKTNSTKYVTDSGAGATAIATGYKTNNGAIGVDSLNNSVPTILEIASKKGLATGLVVTTDITDATPASFAAHQPKRAMHQEIAADFLNSGVDVFIGAGKSHFNKRLDGRDLLAELKNNGYKVSSDIDEITAVKTGKLAGFLSEKPVKERGDQLLKTSMSTINILKENRKGFFLMIEASKIDDGGHDNNLDVVVEEMIDFDKTIGKVLEFAKKDKNTLIIITGDHETGGLTLTNGNIATGKVEGKFSTKGHTGVMLPVFAYGPGAENFMGIYHNNTIFNKLKKVLGL